MAVSPIGFFMEMHLKPMSHFRRSVFVLVAAVSAGCSDRPSQFVAQPGPERTNRADQRADSIAQVSIINALMLGQYRGTTTIEQLLTLGDFGLGTVDHLDGELIVLDGHAYQARSTGDVRELPPNETTPFATVAFFRKDGELPLQNVASLEMLEIHVDAALPERDLFFALRGDVKLASITLRSVPRQAPPYRPLAEVAKEQAEWTRENLRGTLVGIRSPKWTAGLNVPGYHWHFLSDDRRVGGHVFACEISEGTLIYDRCTQWTIELPRGDRAANSPDLHQDLSRELEQVEKQRGK